VQELVVLEMTLRLQLKLEWLVLHLVTLLEELVELVSPQQLLVSQELAQMVFLVEEAEAVL
jgi:hypothetical protein